MQRSLDLFFYTRNRVELSHTKFSHEILEKELHAVRGRSNGFINSVGSFQWTSAVKALSVFFLRVKLELERHSCLFPNAVMSGVGGITSSLDYALGKEPIWLDSMFGSDMHGRLMVKRMILRDNPEMKRVGPVSLRLNRKLFNKDNISIHINGELVEKTEILIALEKSVISQWKERRKIKKTCHIKEAIYSLCS